MATLEKTLITNKCLPKGFVYFINDTFQVLIQKSLNILAVNISPNITENNLILTFIYI